jgi:hypothetical protein
MASGWLSRTVGSKIGRGQGWCLALEGSLVVSYARFGQDMDTNNISSFFQTLEDKERGVMLQ